MPPTNTDSPSQAGVERIQSPLAFAKNGTLIAPSQAARQSSLPVARSKARTTSRFLSSVSVTITRSPTTIGPE
jgi:hypothetical protein